MKQLFTIFFLTAALYCYAQNPIYKQYDKTQGLSSNVIYDALLDANGFIWLAHSKGISRFNGKGFSNYNNMSAQGSAVSNLMCYKNQMFCQDFIGNFFYTKNDSLVKESAIKSSGNFYIAGIIDNKLIHFGLNYYSVFDLENNKDNIKILKDSAGIANYFSTKKCATIGYHHLIEIEKNNILTKEKYVATSNHTLHYLINVNDCYYGYSKYKAPFLFNYAANQFVNISLPQNIYIQNVVVASNEIWVCTSTGAYCFDFNFNAKYNNQPFFKEESLSKVVIDNEGGYWFSTLQNGVLYVPNIRNNNILPQQNITALAVTDNNILAGSNSNSIFSLNNNAQINLLIPHQVEKIVYDKTTQLTGICSDKFYVYKNGVLQYSNTIAVKDVSFVSKDFWFLNTSYGEYIYTTNDKLIPRWLFHDPQLNTVYKINYKTSTPIRGKCIIWNAKDSILYASNAGGLYCYSKNKTDKITYNNQDIFANHLFFVNNKTIATTSNTFYIIDKTNIVNQFAQKDGLPNNISNCTQSNNRIFFTANNNVYVFDEDNKVKMIWQNNGLLNTDIKSIAVDSNKLYIAFNKGVIGVNILNTAAKTNNKPTIAISHFFVNNILVSYLPNISLQEKENNLKFSFATNAYAALDSLKLLYKINDEDWRIVPSNDKNELYLNQMGAGNYRLQLKAINQNNIESNLVEWQFKITQPFYKTIWFSILIASLIIIAIVLYYKKAIAQQKENNKLFSEKLNLEKELQTSLMASIKSQMNPHFLFNALNTIQSYIYTNDKENASQYLSKFSQLTRKILQQSNNDYITLEEEINSLKLYLDLETMRFEDKLHTEFIIDKNINTEAILVPSMLIQPYIENAIKHGLLHKKNNRVLNVSFSKNINELIVTIDDNGIGRKRSAILNNQKQKQHESFAVNANKKRLEILQKNSTVNIAFNIIDKENENRESLGTTVILVLPINTIASISKSK
ncbi:MAG: sensor histidine kinase [Chitinophagaceae bacterium]